MAAMLAGLLSGSPVVASTDWGRAVVDSTLRRFPDPATFGRWNYAFGLYLYGQHLVFQRTREQRYLSYIKTWVDTHVDADGHVDWPLDKMLDNRMPGLLLLALHQESPEPRYKRAIERIRRSLDLHPRTSDGGFWHMATEPGQLWADGAFMMAPFLIEYGRAFPDGGVSRDEAVRQLLVYARHLQDPATGLLFHGYDETGHAAWLAPGTKHSQEFWCRAIGWYGVALVYTLDRLDDAHPERPDLLGVLGKLVPALARHQDPASGRWFQVVDKGSHPANWTETSCSSMHTYVLARAVERRYVSSSYADAAARGYRGVLGRILLDAEGNADLGEISQGTHVGTLGYYLARRRLTNDPHGLGAFLLMHEQLSAMPRNAAPE
jgi:unsaturated rhamnogalacturonyl hydrolase